MAKAIRTRAVNARRQREFCHAATLRAVAEELDAEAKSLRSMR